MKICIVTPYIIKSDGQGRANYELVLEAVRCNHHLSLVTRKIESDLLDNPLIECVSLPVDRFPTELLRGIVFAQKSSSWLRSHRHKFDVVLACGAVTAAASDVNVIHFVHSAWLRSPTHTWKIRQDLYGAYQWLFTALNARWEKQSLQRTKIVVAVSDNIQRELIDIGISRDRIRIIYNGVDLEEFTPKSETRDRFGLPDRVNLALFTGDIRTNRKNLDTVLKALVNVPNLHLAVVGNTERSPYPELARQLGVSDRVHFLGYRRDVAKIMQAVDFFVFPSRYEPFGMVVSEAMASGLPVITTAVSGVAAIITNECGIILDDPEDAQALSQAMTELSINGDLRARMGKSARAIAEQHSWRSKAQQYLHLFTELLSS
ncbi:glycosyltransferase family 4 protein [Pseudanabaena sp. 'Roaring Creek']|uniref:glycosyltransferase family 4 protein n=1 Tax=Pseudanabaena sp. 'Roaring Creek' TaxID=1681830 RepID=UPI0006D7B46D|nr:glycosyltransferase family 4 protein [Pseudanabaena sp. 'Roaring Creek']